MRALHRHLPGRGGGGGGVGGPGPGPRRPRALLVVVDPLEALFAHSDPAPRLAFLRLLWSLASDPALPVVVVGALRIDCIGDCGEIVLDLASDLRLDQVAYDTRHRVFVAQLGAPQLRAATSEPARAVGVDFDPGLVERIVADVAGKPGALPMLQYALKLLWQQRSERRLTAAAYDAIGGVAGALERHAEAVLEPLGPAQLRQARRTLVRLASARGEADGGSRRRVPVDQLRPADPRQVASFARRCIHGLGRKAALIRRARNRGNRCIRGRIPELRPESDGDARTGVDMELFCATCTVGTVLVCHHIRRERRFRRAGSAGRLPDFNFPEPGSSRSEWPD